MGPVSALPRRLFNTGHLAARAMVEHRVPYWPQERLQRLQSRRLQAIIRHAYGSAPYYRRTMDELGPKPIDFDIVEYVADIPPTPAGKFARVVRSTDDSPAPGRLNVG